MTLFVIIFAILVDNLVVMKHKFSFVLLAVASSLISQLASAQISNQLPTRTQPGAIVTRVRIDESTPIFDKKTGKRISFDEYRRLVNSDHKGYHPEPIINEYGEVGGYTLRVTTPEERETQQFYTLPGQKPEVGQETPLFVMKGIDDKVYRSTDLKGHVVVLSFWISLRKPFWGSKQAQQFADVIRPFRTETDPVSLGILQSDKEEITELMATEVLPFIPIPNSYGFHRKFAVTSGPSFLVIDRNGKVAAFIEGSDYEQLKQVLAKVSR